jgi:hypothetical protein
VLTSNQLILFHQLQADRAVYNSARMCQQFAQDQEFAAAISYLYYYSQYNTLCSSG